MFERKALVFRFSRPREKKRIEKIRECSCYRIEKYKINKMIQNIECKTRTLSRYYSPPEEKSNQGCTNFPKCVVLILLVHDCVEYVSTCRRGVLIFIVNY